ncbi:uncharacterized protein LOC133425203 [Cololabis saira]|uniref:uncharacterized protein LOC133425203 n=1 Tax=Cololabis saira TaxID=129043 RepID=UPI002AD30389|nr:uncharacterized protein LOC133425203 [Cololabis saira]
MESSSSEPNVRRVKMKMASVSTVTLFLLGCSLIPSTESAGDCKVYAERGKSVTVPLGKSIPSIYKLQWHQSQAIIFYKKGPTIITGNKDDVDKTGSLVLKGLQQEGTYKADVFGQDGTSIYSSGGIRVCIQDPVKKPTLKMECVKPDFVKFTCTPGQGDKDLKTQWLKNNVSEKDTLPTLTRIAQDVEKDSFSCKVSNQVSSKTSSSLTQTCFIDSTFIFPEEVFGISIWIFVGGGGGIVLLLIVLVIICCIRAKRKSRMHLKDEEEFRLNLGCPDQQHHQNQHPPHAHNHPHHPPNNQPFHQPHHDTAGHTGPRQNRSRTQRPKAPNPPGVDPSPAPRQTVRGPLPAHPVEDEHPPPLPQPRKKVPKPQRA